METETPATRTASYEGFVKVMNHLLFGKLETPSFNDDKLHPLNPNLIKFIPKNADAQKMNWAFEFYYETFESFISKFLDDCINDDKSGGERPYSNHPAAKHLEALVKDKIYHTDLIGYEKKDNEQSLSILFVNSEESCVEYLTFHTLHFLEIVKFINYRQKSISSEDYEKILDHYNTLILKQRIEFLSKKEQA